jgi:hypothetical protein
MEIKKTTGELIKEFGFNISKTIPEVIRGKLMPQHAIWSLIDDCNTIILILITGRILSERAIVRIMQRFDVIAEEMALYLTPEDQIRIGLYWIGVLDYMKERCLEEDQFECCSNIKKFRDYYFSLPPENSND